MKAIGISLRLLLRGLERTFLLQSAADETNRSGRCAVPALMRPAIRVCFALLVSGCGGGRSSNPSAPTRTPAGPMPNAVTHTITGVVADESGRPVAGADVDACCVDQSTYSRLHGAAALTDESGHYR